MWTHRFHTIHQAFLQIWIWGVGLCSLDDVVRGEGTDLYRVLAVTSREKTRQCSHRRCREIERWSMIGTKSEHEPVWQTNHDSTRQKQVDRQNIHRDAVVRAALIDSCHFSRDDYKPIKLQEMVGKYPVFHPPFPLQVFKRWINVISKRVFGAAADFYTGCSV